jgi:hypothetical protein
MFAVVSLVSSYVNRTFPFTQGVYDRTVAGRPEPGEFWYEQEVVTFVFGFSKTNDTWLIP